MHGAGSAVSWFRTVEPLATRHSGNVVLKIGLHTQLAIATIFFKDCFINDVHILPNESCLMDKNSPTYRNLTLKTDS